MKCKYVSECYKVPADIGRRVTVNGKPGVIVKDAGHQIGVNFDDNKPGVVSPCHPTWRVEYGKMGEVREVKLTKAQKRYRRFLEYGDAFDSFVDFCRWDSSKQF